MSDPYAAAPEPASRSRLGCLVACVGLFLLGFAAVGAVLLLRAPSDPRTSPLADLIVPPPGYLLLDDADAGAGPQSASATAALLGVPSVDGFDDALLRAWGRAPEEESRAVVVLVVQLDSGTRATAVRDAYVTAHRATAFAAPAPLHGFSDGPDPAGRYAQRVTFARGSRLWVVSVVTPKRDVDTSEVIRVALAQTE